MIFQGLRVQGLGFVEFRTQGLGKELQDLGQGFKLSF